MMPYDEGHYCLISTHCYYTSDCKINIFTTGIVDHKKEYLYYKRKGNLKTGKKNKLSKYHKELQFN